MIDKQHGRIWSCLDHILSSRNWTLVLYDAVVVNLVCGTRLFSANAITKYCHCTAVVQVALCNVLTRIIRLRVFLILFACAQQFFLCTGTYFKIYFCLLYTVTGNSIFMVDAHCSHGRPTSSIETQSFCKCKRT